MNIVWTNEKIQEWRQRLGYVSHHLMKKTFDNSTQDYPGVRHEREVMPKKSAVAISPGLSYPMFGISRNKKYFPWTCWRIPTLGKSVGDLYFTE